VIGTIAQESCNDNSQGHRRIPTHRATQPPIRGRSTRHACSTSSTIPRLPPHFTVRSPKSYRTKQKLLAIESNFKVGVIVLMKLWPKLTTAIVPRDTGLTGRKESYLVDDFVRVAFAQPEYQTYAGTVVVVVYIVAKGTDPVACGKFAGGYLLRAGRLLRWSCRL
jgi:hypothetical protein